MTGNPEPERSVASRTDTTPYRLFLSRLTNSNDASLSANQRDIIISLRQSGHDLEGQQSKERVAKLLPQEIIFGNNVCTFNEIYPEFCDFLSRSGATISSNSAHSNVRKLAQGLYDKVEQKEVAERLAIEIRRGK